MNMQCSLIWELVFYGFELGHKTVEEANNISCTKVEGMVDHNTVIRWFRKFCLSHKNLNDKTRSGGPKCMNSDAVLQAIEANHQMTLKEYQVSLKSHSPLWFIIFTILAKVYHHRHHVVPLAQISLTLSRHFSLSFIASGRSSGLHPISSHSCWMYVHAGRPTFALLYVGTIGVHLLWARPCFSSSVLHVWFV